jgi:ubiquitin C-terminal hydrolase
MDESAKHEASGEGRINLEQCIALYGEEEQLSEDDPWYCSQCKEHRCAFKKFAFWKLPKILIVHLKRFSYRNKHWREKIESVINFPLEGLDMGPFLQGPTDGIPQLYDLYVVLPSACAHLLTALL